MSLFNSLKKAVQKVIPGNNKLDFHDIVEDIHKEFVKKRESTDYYFYFKPNENKAFAERILSLSDKDKVEFLLYSIRHIPEYNEKRLTTGSGSKYYDLSDIHDNSVKYLLKTKLTFDDDDIESIIEGFNENRRHYYSQSILMWPLGSLIAQIEKNIKEHKVSELLLASIKKLKGLIELDKNYYNPKDKIKLLNKLDTILFQHENDASSVQPVWFIGEDEFAEYANVSLKNLKEDERKHWFRLMRLTQKANGGSPTSKFLMEGKELFKELGPDKFKTLVNDWFRFIITMKEKTTEHHSNYNGRDYTYSTTEFLNAANLDLLKGFIWLCSHFHDKNTLFNIAALAERTYRKIPGKGPAAPSVGNACIYTLANVKGMDGVGQLTRLRLRIKQSNTQNLIEKYLNKAAKEQGVSLHEIEDMAVDEYDLENGEATYSFDEYKALLKITGVGKTELNWFKPDGSPQKSVPAFVRDKYGTRLKKIKDNIKRIELTTTAQRDRIDRMMRSARTLTWQQFHEYYFSHGLMGFLTKKLIWVFEYDNKKEPAIYKKGVWVNPYGPLSFVPNEATTVSVWHPVFYSIKEIEDWRNFLLDNKISQPVKQAFREVYLLTDAEVNTRTYSNRMAAHILKQHQFNSLAKTRGWKYSLLGAYDDGRYNEGASLSLSEYGLRAEFWVNEVNADDAFNDTGIWLYVATDQVRFVKPENNQPIELVDVPALAFSEVMRDVDLFVGVASVGNDPMWRDTGGLVQYRDYWESYSFGDLNEVAKTRKVLLERLVPRLKISKVAEIRDKFLVVKGKLRTYKIHLGSTNILMEPNDQYLCIVPDRSQKQATDTLFLPFEGDNGVSVILSKAFLLADDDKITDTTITSQINKR